MADKNAAKPSTDTADSFLDLLKTAPKSSAANVALVGALSQGDDDTKFVLTLPSGQSVTLAVAAVKRHTLIGNLDGRPLVRIEVDPAQLPQDAPQTALPFSLATGHHVPADVLAQMQGQGLSSHGSGTLGDVGTIPSYDSMLQAHGSGTLGDVGTIPSYDSMLQAHGSGTLGDVGTIPSYDSMLQSHGSGTLGDVGTIPSYDSMLQSHGSGTLGDVGTIPSYDSMIHAHASGMLGDVGTIPSYD